MLPVRSADCLSYLKSCSMKPTKFNELFVKGENAHLVCDLSVPGAGVYELQNCKKQLHKL